MKRKPNIEEKNKVDLEYEKLKYYINRMCVASDLIDLEMMYKLSKKAIEDIYEINTSLFRRPTTH